MKLNSKAFLKKVQECLKCDKMSILETIMAIQEKYKIHEDDLIALVKNEKTLTRDLKAEVIKTHMVKNTTPSLDITDLFF